MITSLSIENDDDDDENHNKNNKKSQLWANQYEKRWKLDLGLDNLIVTVRLVAYFNFIKFKLYGFKKNFHTHTKDGHWAIPWEGGGQKSKGLSK